MMLGFENSLDRWDANVDLMRRNINAQVVWAHFRRSMAKQKVQEYEEILLCSIHVSSMFLCPTPDHYSSTLVM
jgi:hypothetical protein